jgi:Transglutaminase-like superfamily
MEAAMPVCKNLQPTKSLVFILFVCLGVATAQSPKAKTAPTNPKPPVNLGFEDGKVGEVPTGWFFPPMCAKDGYKLALSEDKPFAGKRCAVLSRVGDTDPQAFGNLIQSVDATDYRGKRVRFKAAVRTNVTGEGNQAQLWFRVDRPNDAMGFFDNMGDRPITAKEWKHYEIIGDIAEDATDIVFGMLLLGNGVAAIDDVTFEIVDKATKPTATAPTPRSVASPGLMEVRMAATVMAKGEAATATYLYPLPLAYRDQVPLTFRLSVEPAACAKSIEVVEGPGDNRILKLTLQELDKNEEVKVAYNSVVLVAPTKFDAVPKSAKFPKEWPAEAMPWLASTWCCEHDHERIKKMAAEIRGDSDDVMAVINNVLASAKTTFAKAKGHVNDLTAIEALDKQGSCTSCANLVAALLRGAGVPARILSGYPLWSGPLQTHYIVEAYVPGYGWYPTESTMCQAPWPNHQQINVSIIPIEYESKDKAKMRNPAAGAVPYLSLTELEDASVPVYSIGTLKKYCDHESRMVHPLAANEGEWSSALAWAKPRWATWLKTKPQLTNGRIAYGPDSEELKAKTVSELRQEIK